jgi:membrane protein YdbS with pleckstrin-like domain
MTVITLCTLAILPRQARSIGYQLREDDLVFRRGILWQRMVAVPYGRMPG